MSLEGGKQSCAMWKKPITRCPEWVKALIVLPHPSQQHQIKALYLPLPSSPSVHAQSVVIEPRHAFINLLQITKAEGAELPGEILV
jgi:hypothetical protein